MVDSAFRSDPPASTDQNVINGVESATGVAVPSGAVELPVLEPGAQSLQVVCCAELEHAISIVVCLHGSWVGTHSALHFLICSFKPLI